MTVTDRGLKYGWSAISLCNRLSHFICCSSLNSKDCSEHYIENSSTCACTVQCFAWNSIPKMKSFCLWFSEANKHPSVVNQMFRSFSGYQYLSRSYLIHNMLYAVICILQSFINSLTYHLQSTKNDTFVRTNSSCLWNYIPVHHVCVFVWKWKCKALSRLACGPAVLNSHIIYERLEDVSPSHFLKAHYSANYKLCVCTQLRNIAKFEKTQK